MNIKKILSYLQVHKSFRFIFRVFALRLMPPVNIHLYDDNIGGITKKDSEKRHNHPCIVYTFDIIKINCEKQTKNRLQFYDTTNS